MAYDRDFVTKEDTRKRNRLLGLVYGSYLPVFLIQTFLSPLQYALKFAVVSTFSLLSYAAEKMLGRKLALIFNKIRGFKNVTPAPEDLCEDVMDLCRKAGREETVNVCLFDDSKIPGGRACADMHNIYVGRSVNGKLDREERRFMLAHEFSHINTDDAKDVTMFAPAVSNAVLDGVAAFAMMALTSGADVVTSGYAFILSAVFYEFQSLLENKAIRDIEYRADRNAINLTGDFKSAAKGFVKVEPESLQEVSSLREFFSSHPLGMNRLRALESAANGGKPTYCMDAALALAQRAGGKIKDHPHPEDFIEQAYELTAGGTKPAPQFL